VKTCPTCGRSCLCCRYLTREEIDRRVAGVIAYRFTADKRPWWRRWIDNLKGRTHD